ncbi:hypothetical protein AVEN_224452-1 [Araneus ventricosus]|uniref:Uncharacterized protein n=1 Tax=Araneus ventricosus TaxID=182803 RepID=A0A4Y2SBD3_ARAVE|nr:hypothetical protein AVEN_224452-1 [Araneus ventricosus]
MALISIVYRRSNRRLISSSGLEKPNQRRSYRVVFFHCSRQLYSLTSLAGAAPSTGTRLRLVAHSIVTKIVCWVYDESNPKIWITENDLLFNEYSRKLESQVSRKELRLHKLATQADNKSLIAKEIALQ